MRLALLGRVAVLVLCTTQWCLGQTATTPIAAPGPSASPASVPICQWGNCAAVCDKECPAGSVCGVKGTCVELVDRQQISQDVEAAEDDKRDTVRSLASRRRARYWPRFALGGGIGGVGLFDRQGRAGEFLAHFGVRKQLGESIGLHTQLVGALGLRIEKDATGKSHSLTLQEVVVSVSPYFGPFDRIYIGPTVLVGYRWYSDAIKQWFASTAVVHNHLVREGGARFGILAGSEEQIDITGIFSSSFDADTPWRMMVNIAYELR